MDALGTCRLTSSGDASHRELPDRPAGRLTSTCARAAGTRTRELQQLTRPAYPKCQGRPSERGGCEQRLARLLPVPYFHVVFTVPSELASVILRNKRLGYATLFAAASETLKTIAQDPKRLGAQLAITAVLHTRGCRICCFTRTCIVWSPVVGCSPRPSSAGSSGQGVIPAAGPSPGEDVSWQVSGAARALPTRQQQLDPRWYLAELKDPSQWTRLRRFSNHRDWVVYAKAPFGNGATSLLPRPLHLTAWPSATTGSCAPTARRSPSRSATVGTIARPSSSRSRSSDSSQIPAARPAPAGRPHPALRPGLANVRHQARGGSRLLARGRSDCQRTEPGRVTWSIARQLGERDISICPPLQPAARAPPRILPEQRQSYGNGGAGLAGTRRSWWR